MGPGPRPNHGYPSSPGTSPFPRLTCLHVPSPVLTVAMYWVPLSCFSAWALCTHFTEKESEAMRGEETVQGLSRG